MSPILVCVESTGVAAQLPAEPADTLGSRVGSTRVSHKISVWTRVKRFFRPERETYETRQARPGQPGEPLGTQKYEATDQRRHGGPSGIGG